MASSYSAPPTLVTVYPSVRDGVKLGTDTIRNTVFPLIVASAEGDHYFHAYEHEGAIVWDVFMWHEELRCPIYEVRASKPALHGGWEAGDVVIFENNIDFELAIKGGEIQVVSGAVKISCGDHGISIGGLQATNNAFDGLFAAYRVEAGSISMGVGGGPPEGMKLAQLDPAGH